MSSSESGSVTGGAGGAPTGGVGGAACHPGDAPVMLAAGKPGPTALAIDEAFAYFWVSGELSCDSSGVLGRVPKAGGAIEELGHTVRAVTALAVDEERLYWTDDPSTSAASRTIRDTLVYAMPKAGGAPVELQMPDGAQGAVSLVLDSARVYYAADVQPVFSVTKMTSLRKSMTPGWPPSDVGVDAVHLFVLGPTALFLDRPRSKGQPGDAPLGERRAAGPRARRGSPLFRRVGRVRRRRVPVRDRRSPIARQGRGVGPP